MHLLLIEDSERLRRSLTAGLKRAGYAVDCAADGEDGLWKAQEREYDAILLDLMLPGIDGLEILRRLRAGGLLALELAEMRAREVAAWLARYLGTGGDAGVAR